jgi:hypothetical protein
MPTGWRFTLPAGDATLGKQVFEKMQCYSCHTVRGQRFGDPSQNPGGIAGPIHTTTRGVRCPPPGWPDRSSLRWSTSA